MEYITLLRRDLHSWMEAETRSRKRETDWANGMELEIAVFPSFSRLWTINYLSAGGNYRAGGKDTVTIAFIFPLWLTVDPHQRADLISYVCVSVNRLQRLSQYWCCLTSSTQTMIIVRIFLKTYWLKESWTALKKAVHFNSNRLFSVLFWTPLVETLCSNGRGKFQSRK